MKLDALRHLEPDAARDHTVCEVRLTHACRECAERAVGARMAVGADDDVTRHDEPFFGKEGMLDAALPAFEEID